MTEEKLKEIKDKLNTEVISCKNIEEYEMIHELYNEVIRLKEKLSKCTRKHWQSKCAEHCVNEKILQSRIEKAVEYINSKKRTITKYEAENTRLPIDTFMYGVDNLLDILNGDKSE